MKERLGTLQAIVFDHPGQEVGCAQIRRLDGSEYYVGFAQIVPVANNVYELHEDVMRTSGRIAHLVEVPDELLINGSLIGLKA